MRLFSVGKAQKCNHDRVLAYWASPRRRRRLLWAGALVLLVAGFLGINALLPSQADRRLSR
jgi:type II secretory pathway component PulM